MELIDRTPCLYEYRLWYFTFRRPEPFPRPSPFEAGQCAAAAKVHERIEQERADAQRVQDPSPTLKDADERAVDCLHEYRLWALLDKGATRFDEALETFAPFKVHGTEQCTKARAADERIAAADAVRKARERADSERMEREAARAKSAQARRLSDDRAAREAMARRPAVRIGMTQKEVMERSNWGPPEGRRRTTTAAVVREQWIYGGGRYLYFENGTLVAIQD